MDLNWNDMRVFLAVARRESLSGAGRVLQVDPATVGRRVSRLEETFGTPLFAKSQQGYALTDAGQRLQAHAERAEQAMQGAQDALPGSTATLAGQIRIGAPDGVANFLLPQVCAAIGAGNPELDIQIVALPRVFNLSRREADMAVTVSPPTAGRLTVQKITEYHLHLAGAESYLSQAPCLTQRADLKNHRIIGYIPDMIFDKELDYLSELGAPRVPLASNSVAVQLNAIRQGAGLGIVHDISLPSAPGVARDLNDQVSLARRIYLVRHADDRRLDRLNRFATALIAGLRQEVARLEALA